MPRAWTSKDERQYEHVKESERKRGRSPRRATEIAARTVNKNRREEGRTANKTTMGTGNPAKSLQERPVQELRNLASDLKVPGRSRMKKADLVREIRKRR